MTDGGQQGGPSPRRVAPGRVYIAPVGSEFDSSQWQDLGTATADGITWDGIMDFSSGLEDLAYPPQYTYVTQAQLTPAMYRILAGVPAQECVAPRAAARVHPIRRARRRPPGRSGW